MKGFQVAPAELETVLRSHPAVAECGVVGGAAGGAEEPLAFAALRWGARAQPEELAAFLNARLAPFKHVRTVRVVPHIPKNPAGKILRKALKDKYC